MVASQDVSTGEWFVKRGYETLADAEAIERIECIGFARSTFKIAQANVIIGWRHKGVQVQQYRSRRYHNMLRYFGRLPEKSRDQSGGGSTGLPTIFGTLKFASPVRQEFAPQSRCSKRCDFRFHGRNDSLPIQLDAPRKCGIVPMLYFS